MIPLFKVHMAEGAPARAEKVLRSGYIGQGSMVEEFELLLAERVGTKNILTTNSGTSALDLALACLDIGPGDEVISTPMTCTATNMVIHNRGAQIVWADIDPVSGLISAESVTSLITHGTKAVVVVDWGGTRVPVELGLGRRDLSLIIDSAHRAPVVDNRKDGLENIFIAYSFQAIKFLTTGDGGALLVPDKYYAKAKLQRWFGLDRDSSSDFRCAQRIQHPGFKYHMNDIAAAIGIENLAGIDERILRHQRVFQKYEDYGLQAVDHSDSHHWVAFIHVNERDAFQRYMTEKGITTSLVHSRNDRHPIFSSARRDKLDGLEKFDKTYCAIPCGWWLSTSQIEFIVDSVLAWEGKNGRPD